VDTPVFIPLATKATVKSLLPQDLEEMGIQMLLANTYHLHLRPGEETIARLGGLHAFMGWKGALMTDSGGFQVFSLGHGYVADEIKGKGRPAGGQGQSQVVRITEEGVTFASYIDGSRQQLTPESCIDIQHKLGSDIAVVLDECTPYHVTYEYTRASLERTHRWAQRCLTAHQALPSQPKPSLFGIVQGGVYQELREASARFLTRLPFDGFCIGGSLGKDKEEMQRVVGWVTPLLPEDSPRHLLGIGEIDDLLAGVEQGIDMFDCAMPTRLARHGTLLVSEPQRRWRIAIANAEYALDTGPVEPGCPCPTCQGFSRAYLHYLFRNQEITGIRLATLHNVYYIHRLMGEVRRSILEDRFQEFKKSFLGEG
jgi:queuine tRNA-ribosyltransferase